MTKLPKYLKVGGGLILLILLIVLSGCYPENFSRDNYCKNLKYNEWGWENDLLDGDFDFYCYRTNINNEKDYVNQTFVTHKEYDDWVNIMTGR